jgi:hypothetical protein
MRFFLKLLVALINNLAANQEIVDSAGDGSFYAILASSSLFYEHSKNSGFATLNAVSSVAAPNQIVYIELILAELCAVLPEYIKTLGSWHPGVKKSNLHLYVGDEKIPSIISPLHLICQSLCHEHVLFRFIYFINRRQTLLHKRLRLSWASPLVSWVNYQMSSPSPFCASSIRLGVSSELSTRSSLAGKSSNRLDSEDTFVKLKWDICAII